VSKAVYILAHPTARQRAIDAVRNAADGMVVTVAEPSRNLEQNAALWAILSEVSEHVVWHGRKLSPEDWKHVFTASLKRMDVVPNLEGTGFVALGLSTSKMSKREFSDLLELVNAFAAERIEATA
jgi:hypothetical protein